MRNYKIYYKYKKIRHIKFVKYQNAGIFNKKWLLKQHFLRIFFLYLLIIKLTLLN